MSSPPIHIQLGLFGGFADIAGMHVVAAHTRVQSDHTEVFVAEHLRWNRGRTATRGATPKAPFAPPGDHPTLFELAPLESRSR